MDLIVELSDPSDTSSAMALVYEASAAFVHRLRQLQQVAAGHDLTEARCYAYPSRTIHRGDCERALQAPEACVSRREVYFTARDDDAVLQTPVIDMDVIVTAFERGCEQLVVIWSGVGEVDYILDRVGIEAASADIGTRLIVHTRDGVFRPEMLVQTERG